MNGVHDMGGMDGMGRVQYEKNEPVFHTPWEGRTLALNLAVAAWNKWNIDAGRHQIELIPAAEYLRMSYYEQWIAGLVELLVKTGLVTRAEVESGEPTPNSPKAIPPLTADNLAPPDRTRYACEPRRSGGPALQSGPARPAPQHASGRSHPPAALRARKAWDD